MMRAHLIPGPLAQTIEYDDEHHKLMVDFHLVPLSVTQYRLVVALLRQRLRWDADTSGTVPLLLPVQQLQTLAQIASPDLVRQHLRRASLRLAKRQWLLVNLHGYGYGAFRPSEVLWAAAEGYFPELPG